jgi:hypothetical protein
MYLQLDVDESLQQRKRRDHHELHLERQRLDLVNVRERRVPI